MQEYLSSVNKAVQWLEMHIQDDGSYGEKAKDLACYYKSPYLFSLLGKRQTANRMLDYIGEHFMLSNGDFAMSPTLKSENGVFNSYWPYINGWIVIAAQRMGRFDLSYPGYAFLEKFDIGDDAFSTAHLGLVALYMGDKGRAERAGKQLELFLELNGKHPEAFYLKMDHNRKLITAFSPEQAFFYKISAADSNQAYFMIGYPIAFLSQLYQATGQESYLAAAKSYFDFAGHCRGNIASFHFSHKVAWGAALLARITQDQREAALAKSIAGHLVHSQDASGCWLKGEPSHTVFDQTAEVAIWLHEML